MAIGTNTYMDMAAPLYPNKGVHIEQKAAAGGEDLLTLSLGASASDDILVGRLGTTEKFVFASTGALNTLPSVTIPGAAGVAGVVLEKTGTGQTTFARLRLPVLATAAASAGLTKGDIWLAKATTDVYRFALCISTATGAERFGHRFTRTTLGSASH